jgi:hypothetical protein
VIPARSLQLLVGTTFLVCWVIPKAFLLPPFTLLYPEQMFKIPALLQVMNKCSLFQNNTTFFIWFLITGFNLLFLSALDGNAIKITDTNFTELDWLCDEFGFTELATKLSEFRPSIDLKEVETEAEAETETETEDADARGCTRTNCSSERKGKSTLPRHCDFGGQSHSTLHRPSTLCR